ncbi:unnamed protein product [Parnassius apollo]|uniref:(apollo) hypothetical protein n=1 Tax=Parnassius apollo TaxID=110799 RepID=A0A8S3WXF9_PARAO|nr:unnamed protein product [Parnassius apollo]
MWYSDGENLVIDKEQVMYVRAEKIPGQKKITSSMSDDEKLAVAEENERIRQAAVKLAEMETLKKIYLTGKFLNLGIPEQGYYDKNNPKHREAITEKPPTPVVLPTPIYSKYITTLIIICQNIDNIMYLYETDQQLRDNFKIKTPSYIKVEKQPKDHTIRLQTTLNNA